MDELLTLKAHSATSVIAAADLGLVFSENVLSDSASTERTAGSAPADAVRSAGALTVTRPPENTGKEGELAGRPIAPEVLIAGTDTLDLGLYVEFPESYPRLVQILARWKRAASGSKGLVVGGGRCLVSPGGKPNYPFHLRYPQFELYLSRHPCPQGDTPNVFVSLGSQLLWERGDRDRQ